MIFSVDQSIPANTPLASPVSIILPIPAGLIYQVHVYFPGGCSGLLRTALFMETVQLYPFTRGTWFRGDNLSVVFPDLYLYSDSARRLIVKAYNLDTQFDHACIWHIGLISDEDIIATYLQRATKGVNPVVTLETPTTPSASPSDYSNALHTYNSEIGGQL